MTPIHISNPAPSPRSYSQILKQLRNRGVRQNVTFVTHTGQAGGCGGGVAEVRSFLILNPRGRQTYLSQAVLGSHWLLFKGPASV